MANQTKIEWTDVTWNPTFGCSRVSAGCGQPSGGGCYAEALALRWGLSESSWTARNAAENVLLKPHKLREPLSGAKAWRGLGPAAAAAGKTDGKLVFVNSMSDLFHEQIPWRYVADVFAVMAQAEQHTFQVLTKRPERMRTMLDSSEFWETVEAKLGVPLGAWVTGFLPNVWLGVSIENRKWVGRADVLRETPAAVRFISAEPLLGPLIYDRGCTPNCSCGNWDGELRFSSGPPGPELDLTGIDWLIVGGESGPNHRPFDPQWARDLRDACWDSQHRYSPLRDADASLRNWTGTRFFMKQQGGARPGTALEDLPEDLRIREFPTTRQAAT